MVLESQIEKDIRIHLRDVYGVRLVKYSDPGMTGGPDRIALCPGGRVFFLETKRPGGVTSYHQDLYHAWLIKKGFTVAVVESVAEAEAVAKEFL